MIIFELLIIFQYDVSLGNTIAYISSTSYFYYCSFNKQLI